MRTLVAVLPQLHPHTHYSLSENPTKGIRVPVQDITKFTEE